MLYEVVDALYIIQNLYKEMVHFGLCLRIVVMRSVGKLWMRKPKKKRRKRRVLIIAMIKAPED